MEASRRPSLPERILISQQLSPRPLVRLLIIVVTALLVADLALQIYHYRVREVPWLLKDLFDLDEEQNIPTWYSAAALLLTSWLLRAIADVKKRSGDPDHRYWFWLMAGFLFLSFDEAAGLHEALNNLTNSDTSNNPFSWAFLGAGVVVIVAVIYMKFVSRLPVWFRDRCLIAGMVYVSGVVGMELIAHQYIQHHDIDTLGYNVISAAEEALEMFGVVVFIHALLTYMGMGEVMGGMSAAAAAGTEIVAFPAATAVAESKAGGAAGSEASSRPAEPAGPSG